MKKKILFVLAFAVLACMLCLGAMAQTTYYLYDDETTLPEGENNMSVSELYWQSETETGFFAKLADGDDVVFELKENISYAPGGTLNTKPNESNALRISVAANVTIKLNGFSWWFTSKSAYDAFVLYNEGATLNLIGTKAKNPDGTIKEIGTSYSVEEVNDNIDIFSNFVVVYQAGGRLNCENLAVSCVEETIYQKMEYLSGYNVIELIDCSMLTKGGYYTINLNGKGSSSNDLKICGGLYGSIKADNLLEDSYIKNATILSTKDSNSLYIDSWKDRNKYEFFIENTEFKGKLHCEGDSNVIIAENSVFGILYLKGDKTGGAYAELTDCSYASVDFTGNNGITGQLTVYTSPTCTIAGTKTVYDINNTNGVIDKGYEAPALGHSFDKDNIINVAYESYLENGVYISTCLVCGNEGQATETEGTAPALFIFKGYSAPVKKGVYGIVLSYILNKSAIADFISLTGSSVEYGTVAAVKENLGESNPLDENGNAIKLENGVVIKATLDNNYSAFDFKITGIAEDQRSIGLVIATYVIVNGKIVYLQGDNQLTSDLAAYSYDTTPMGEE